jgi:hypothetical protein
MSMMMMMMIMAPWSSVLLEKLIVTQLVEKFPTMYGSRRLITVFTGAIHWSISKMVLFGTK